MKLQLLHGPAINSSRARLTQIKQKFGRNNVVVYEEGASISDIVGGSATIPLIPEPRLVILENPSEDLAIPTIDSSDLMFVLWFDHEVNSKKPILESVKKVKGEIIFFPEAKEMSVFPFLDYLAAKDKKAFLELGKLKTAGFDIQYFLTMVFYLLRSLSCTPKNAPSFVKDKLSRQRKHFPLERITNLYREIIEIDFKIKSGLLEKEQAEFLLINKFLDY